MNDVDPMSMTLSEIYDQPEHYFELIDCFRDFMDNCSDQLIRTLYHGAALRMHGRVFFDIKENDVRDEYQDSDHDSCGLCSSQGRGALTDDKEMLERPHP